MGPFSKSIQSKCNYRAPELVQMIVKLNHMSIHVQISIHKTWFILGPYVGLFRLNLNLKVIMASVS